MIHSILGLTISHSRITIAHIEDTNGSPSIKHVDTLPLPPLALGGIRDAVAIGIQLKTRLHQLAISVEFVAITIADTPITHMIKPLHFDREADYQAAAVEHLTSRLEPTADPLYVAHHCSRSDSSRSDTHPHTLMAGTPQADVQFCIELAQQLEGQLIAIDLPTLALIRALNWKRPSSDCAELVLIELNNRLYFYCLNAGSVVLSQVINHIDLDTMDDSTLTLIRDKFKHFCLSAQSQIPNLHPIQTIYIMGFESSLEPVLHDLRSQFDGYTFQGFEAPTTVVHTPSETTPHRPLRIHHWSAIGLALKYFEPTSKSFNFIKAKKRRAPLINPVYLTGAIVISLVTMGLIYGASAWLTHRIKTTEETMMSTRQALTTLVSQSTNTDQVALQALDNQIQSFGALPQRSSYGQWLSFVTQDLPDDVSFDSLSIHTDGHIQLNGQALSSHSIHEFYNALESHFNSVTLSEVSIQYHNQDIPVHSYQLRLREVSP